MDLNPPTCNHPECKVTLHARPAMARRGERTVAYEAVGWRCNRCADPDTGKPPLEFLDAALMAANEDALTSAWREKYDEDVPPTGRPGRKTEAPRTERIAVLLTPEELVRVDARRGSRSRSEFLREVIGDTLRRRTG
jgi:hypothetical protein